MTSLKNSQDNLYNINLKIKFRLNMVDLSPLSQKKVVHEDQIIHCVSKKTLIIGFVIGGDHHLQKKIEMKNIIMPYLDGSRHSILPCGGA